MRIVVLNVWGGRVQSAFTDFFRKYADKVDVFCLQEVYKDASGPFRETPFEAVAKLESFSVLEKLLPEHELIFHPSFRDAYGICICIRKSLRILEVGESFIYKYKGYVPDGDMGRHARNMQYAVVDNASPLTIVNVHALWNGLGKGDSDERLDQSKNIVRTLNELPKPVVLCGDFNLDPNTESIQMIERTSLRNLIGEYSITSTRTPLYEKPGKFADYCFVSPGVHVKDFQVLPDVVSDHAPLLLEI
ncbi:MAG: endonuclease/exonuclease/phosphatase family protein [Candidatus Doudnabacteria bacterium]|nr:endonuclease/exonuclease/phosphatase family protein [Candidatus Doudnabacteria bacterium]